MPQSTESSPVTHSNNMGEFYFLAIFRIQDRIVSSCCASTMDEEKALAKQQQNVQIKKKKTPFEEDESDVPLGLSSKAVCTQVSFAVLLFSRFLSPGERWTWMSTLNSCTAERVVYRSLVAPCICCRDYLIVRNMNYCTFGNANGESLLIYLLGATLTNWIAQMHCTWNESYESNI